MTIFCFIFHLTVLLTETLEFFQTSIHCLNFIINLTKSVEIYTINNSNM